MRTLSVGTQKEIFYRFLLAAIRWKESVQMLIPSAINFEKEERKERRKVLCDKGHQKTKNFLCCNEKKNYFEESHMQ